MRKLPILATLMCGALLATPGVQAKTLTIGFTASQTGKYNADSTSQMLGLKLWADGVNSAGGLKVGGNDYTIALKSYDDQSTASRVQQLYSRLILQDNADFLVSPYSSGLTATAAVVSEQFGKVMLTTGAAEGKTYELGNKHLFQMYTPAQYYLKSALDVIKAKSPNAKVALIYANNGFSTAVAKGAVASAKKMGLNLVFNEAYSPSTTDFGPIINKIVASGATVLIGGGHFADGSTLARQIFDKKVPLKFISILVAPDSPKFAQLGKAAEGVTVPSQWEHTVGYKPDFGPTPAAFTKAFKAKNNFTPGYHAAGGYAAGLVLQHAIEQAGSVDAKAVTKALDSLDAVTFFGHIKFSNAAGSHGLEIGHDMVLAQWQRNGSGDLKLQVVWPTVAETAPLVYPLTRFAK